MCLHLNLITFGLYILQMHQCRRYAANKLEKLLLARSEVTFHQFNNHMELVLGMGQYTKPQYHP